MSTLLTVLIAVLVFGFLILIHELGHYIFARIFGVTIKEFSIGMGPKLFWYDSKKTGIRYSISMLPLGGYVAMAGEDGESEDPNSFDKKPAWQRFIITAAGATVNIVAGALAMILLTTMIPLGSTTVHSFVDKNESGYDVSTSESGLCAGDTILRIDGKRVAILDELNYEVMRRGNEPVDLLVLRDGEEVLLSDVVFPTEEQEGQVFGMPDFKVLRTEKTLGSVLSYAFRKSCLIVRMCWESLYDLIVGRYTLAAVSGPVGISSAIGDAARAGFTSLLYITVLISINLGVMNLLPLPALDGGRLVFLVLEAIRRKPIKQELEGYVHFAGIVVLMALMVVIILKDVISLFG